MQDELTDAQLARLLAEAMGLEVVTSDDLGRVWVVGSYRRQLPFDPANDWRDFGRALRWATEKYSAVVQDWLTLWVRNVNVTDWNPRRAFCLALCRALGVA